MNRIALFVSLILLCSAAQVYSSDDIVARAQKLYEKRRYAEVISLLGSDPASIQPADQGTANLTLGLAYFKNAELHRELLRASASAAQNYLKKLLTGQGQDRSRFVDLYYGDVLTELGKPEVAAISFEQFSSNEDVEQKYRLISKVRLGLCFFLENDPQKADELWSSIPTTEPEVKSELAAAYVRAGRADKNPVALAEEALSEGKLSGEPVSMRLTMNLLSVYAGSGLTNKGLDVLRRADLKAHSYREVLGKSKIIHFYDLSLLKNMSALYGQASLDRLEKAAADPKTRDIALYFLGQAYALYGSLDQSSKSIDTFLASSRLPVPYQDRLRVWQGTNLFRRNRQTEAAGLWNELARKQPADPDLLAEILQACDRVRTECPRALQLAEALAGTGDGKKIANLSVSLGKYHLGTLDNAAAVSHLEAGRDKSNKNKMESNDPEMLVNLAEAYQRTRKYSESLEIYFEMSKQLPEVRQIREALQGIYAMEQKSSGDVKIR